MDVIVRRPWCRRTPASLGAGLACEGRRRPRVPPLHPSGLSEPHGSAEGQGRAQTAGFQPPAARAGSRAGMLSGAADQQPWRGHLSRAQNAGTAGPRDL
jgi:hypothetical protein